MHHEAFPEEQPEHPGDVEPLHRQMFARGADLAGLGLTTVGQTLRRRPLPAEIASVLSLVDSTPRLRALLEERVGEASADLVIAAAKRDGSGARAGSARPAGRRRPPPGDDRGHLRAARGVARAGA